MAASVAALLFAATSSRDSEARQIREVPDPNDYKAVLTWPLRGQPDALPANSIGRTVAGAMLHVRLGELEPWEQFQLGRYAFVQGDVSLAATSFACSGQAPYVTQSAIAMSRLPDREQRVKAQQLLALLTSAACSSGKVARGSGWAP